MTVGLVACRAGLGPCRARAERAIFAAASRGMTSANSAYYVPARYLLGNVPHRPRPRPLARFTSYFLLTAHRAFVSSTSLQYRCPQSPHPYPSAIHPPTASSQFTNSSQSALSRLSTPPAPPQRFVENRPTRNIRELLVLCPSTNPSSTQTPSLRAHAIVGALSRHAATLDTFLVRICYR